MADLRYDKVRTPYVLDLTQLDLNKIGDLETVWDRTNKVLIIRDGASIYKLNSAGATLLSPNGSKFKVVVSDDGTLTTELSDDPNVDGEVDQINGFITQINSGISIIEGKIVDIESDLIECDTKVEALKIDVDTIKPALDQSIIDAKAQNTTLTQTINEGNTANSAMNASIVVSTQLNADLGNTSNISTVRKQELEEVISSIPTEVQKITDEGVKQTNLLATANEGYIRDVESDSESVLITTQQLMGNLNEDYVTASTNLSDKTARSIELINRIANEAIEVIRKIKEGL